MLLFLKIVATAILLYKIIGAIYATIQTQIL